MVHFHRYAGMMYWELLNDTGSGLFSVAGLGKHTLKYSKIQNY